MRSRILATIGVLSIALVAVPAGWAAPVTLQPPTFMTSHGATLNWTVSDTPDPFPGYEIHRSSTPQFVPTGATRIATVANRQTTTFQDQGASPDGTYFYKVVVDGTASGEQEVTLPPDGQEELVLYASAATFIHDYSDVREMPPFLQVCDNTGASEQLHVRSGGSVWGGQKYSRTLLKFDLSPLPFPVFYTDVVLQVWNQNPSAQATVEVHRVTQPWVEGTSPFQAETCPAADGATWIAPRPGFSWTAPGGDFDALVEDSVEVTAGPLEHWDEFDIGDLFVEWEDQVYQNNGLIIKRVTEPGTSGPEYASDEAVTPEKRPRLVVSYFPGAPPALRPTLIDEEDGGAADQVSNFGGHDYYRGWRTPIFGTRADMVNPSSDTFGLDNFSLGIFRVAAEIDPVRGSALQIGMAMTRGSSCKRGGSRNRLTYMWELVVSGEYLCRWLDNDPPFVPSDRNLFTVLRTASVCEESPQGPYYWEARINGIKKICSSMPNRRPFAIRAGGEVATTGQSLHNADMSTCYGCGSGGTPWQFARQTEEQWSAVTRRRPGRLGYRKFSSQGGNWGIGDIPQQPPYAWAITNHR